MLLLWALLGALGGALAYRLADQVLEARAGGRMGWTPRCPRCGRAESPARRLALVATALRLRCPGCGLPPARQQAIAEAGTALLVAGIGWRQGDEPIRAAVYAVATIVLVALTLTDLRERLLPNAITYPAGVGALLAAALLGALGGLGAAAVAGGDPALTDLVRGGARGVLGAVGGGLAGGALALLMLVGGLLLYRRADVFGVGDVKLAVLIGLVVGFPRVLNALALGVIAGGVIGLGVMAAGRSKRATMPYGPALALGAYVAMLTAPTG